MIEIKGVRPSAKELRTNWRMRRGWVSYGLGVVAAIPTLGMIGLYWIASRASSEAAFWPLTLTFLVALVLPVLARTLLLWLMDVGVDQTPYDRQAYVWTLDTDGIAQTGELGSGKTSWEAISDVREDSDRFVFLISPAGHPVLPKRPMSSDQISAVRALIAEVRAAGRLGRGVD